MTPDEIMKVIEILSAFCFGLGLGGHIENRRILNGLRKLPWWGESK